MKAEDEEHWGLRTWSLTGIGQWRPSLVGLNWFPVKGETQQQVWVLTMQGFSPQPH